MSGPAPDACLLCKGYECHTLCRDHVPAFPRSDGYTLHVLHWPEAGAVLCLICSVMNLSSLALVALYRPQHRAYLSQLVNAR